jgi:hypothetical protein
LTLKIFSAVIPESTAAKIELVTKDEGKSKIIGAFGPDGVDQKYGGNVPNIIGSQWPPRPTKDCIPQDSPVERFTINGPETDAKLFPEPYRSHPFLTLMSQNFNATVWIIVIFIFSTALALVFLKK